jgi:hypothetical protein
MQVLETPYCVAVDTITIGDGNEQAWYVDDVAVRLYYRGNE